MPEESIDKQNILSQFTKGLFWSYDINKFDYIKNKKIVIEQVLEAGLEDDEILMWKLYSYEDIKNVAVNIEYLEPDVLTYIAFVLKIKEEKFKSYGKKPWYRKYPEKYILNKDQEGFIKIIKDDIKTPDLPEIIKQAIEEYNYKNSIGLKAEAP
ncbi:MAG: hypothetical protein LBC52_03395 [Treponema sp.]|nr:hypothetical protein [Treponema sp.]